MRRRPMTELMRINAVGNTKRALFVCDRLTSRSVALVRRSTAIRDLFAQLESVGVTDAYAQAHAGGGIQGYTRRTPPFSMIMVPFV